MKSVCITGCVQRNLDLFAARLSQAGAATSRPAINGTEFSMSDWHHKVMALQAHEMDLEAPPIFGRVWEQLAGNILLANHAQPLWYWADERSIHFLDFWHGFDTNIFFVFVHTTPHQVLMNAIEQGRETVEALQATLTEWYRCTQLFLRFHLRSPSRSVILDSDNALNCSSEYIEKLTDLWSLPLGKLSDETPRQTNDSLELYLLDQFLRNHPEALALNDEVKSSLLQIKDEANETSYPELSAALADCLNTRRHLHQEIAEKQRFRKELEGSKVLLDNIESKLYRVNTERTLIQNELEDLSRENAKLIVTRDALIAGQVGQVAASDYQDGTEGENELLLIQLHETQEELEASISKLHKMQITMDRYKIKLQRVLDCHPSYWHFNSVEACVLDGISGRHTVQWQFIDVDVGECLIPELRFKTVLVDGIAGIIFQRTQGPESPEPLLRWPSVSTTAEELCCIPVKGPINSGNNAILSGLGPTDWKILQTLVQRLSVLLAEPNGFQIPEGVDVPNLRNGLLALDKALAEWPNVLRYDDIRLHKILNIDGYHSLEIELVNPQLGQQVWPDFSYRIATVFEPGKTFSQNPRLEFPEKTRNVLQNWFAESNDERGARMELRFAHPSLMDTNVWSALAGNDRLLIAALITSTSTQLEEIRRKNSTVSQPWQDWVAVGKSMRSILANTMAMNTRPQGV
jgi:hypothetical protein